MGSYNLSGDESRVRQAQNNLEAAKNNLAYAIERNFSEGQIEKARAQVKDQEMILKGAKQQLERAREKAQQEDIKKLKKETEKREKEQSNKIKREKNKSQKISSSNSSTCNKNDNSLFIKIFFTVFPLLLGWWMFKIPFYIISFPVRVIFSRNKRFLPYYSFKRF